MACLIIFSQTASALTSRDYAIELTATILESPPQIILNWRTTGDGLSFQVARKLKHQTSWTVLETLPSTATTYTDSNVAIGTVYEYAVTKQPQPSFGRSGYIFAGINAPLVDTRGKMLLIVEETHASYLSMELSRLQQDLIGDGWTVSRRTVSRHDTPAHVRGLIQTEYQADPNLRAVFLFGRIPVAYSGNYNADDHIEHTGAWAADTFYADLNGTWTDSTESNTSAARAANHNVPGDGKYDQSTIPSDIDLELGRVDLSNMSAFLPKTERDLLRQYLNKNNNFRHGRISAARRGIIYDGFGESGGEAYAASGWRNFAPFFGSANINEVGDNQFFPTASSQSYLWTYVGSGGGREYDNSHWVGRTSDFASNDIRTIFTMFFGSYFGDWDTSNNFLRAPLASESYTLTAAWAGRPHWFFHHMAMGETIGYSTRLSQNNSGLYAPTQFTRQVHIALMGDPTLRMHVVLPPSNLTAEKTGNGITLNWNASADSNVIGYHVYRSPSANGPFTRLTGNSPVTHRSFSDNSGNGSYTYKVRAIKLETSESGSYYNASQGIFVNGTGSQAGITLPETIAGLSFTFTPEQNNGSPDRLMLVVSPDGNSARLFTGDGTIPLETGSFVYAHNSSTTATTLFGAAQISLSFTSGASGLFSALNLGGNSYSGTFSLLETEADFNGDAQVDLLFQGGNRVLHTWFLQSTNFIGNAVLRNGLPAGTGWRVSGTADFNGDEKPDVLFQHDSGRHAIWFMDGTTYLGAQNLKGPTAPSEWKSVALGDFNGDRIQDLVFQHEKGSLAVWLMDANRTNVLRTISLPKNPGSTWRVFAACDFNQDRKTDLLFQHTTTGKLAVWYFDDLNLLGTELLRNGQAVPTVWRALGLADLNNDGKNDIIFQHTKGALVVWFMDGKDMIGSASLRNGVVPAAGGRLVGPN